MTRRKPVKLNWRQDAKDPEKVIDFIASIGRTPAGRWERVLGVLDRCMVHRPTASNVTASERQQAESARIAQKRFCDSMALRQFSVTHGGHYCTYGIECPYRRTGWKLGPPVQVRSFSEFSPIRYSTDARTTDIRRLWLKQLLEMRSEGGLLAATANSALTDSHWDVVDTLARSQWPRMDASARRTEAQKLLAVCIAAATDATKRAERERTEQGAS